MPQEIKASKKHTLVIESRERLSATGVKKVNIVSPGMISAQTEIGQLNIKGENLFMESLDSSGEQLFVRGSIAAVSYTQNEPSASVIKRLLK